MSPAWDLHLEVDMDVVPEYVYSEELAPADLTGVLLVTVGQQMLVHVAPAREHLGTGSQCSERRSLDIRRSQSLWTTGQAVTRPRTSSKFF